MRYYDEEILRIKICGHRFHAECLAAWHLCEPTSCPVCRRRYFFYTMAATPTPS
ncbi:hypothetical protein GGR50DRAFT_654086 [Xylaria sp. CBS 124048]|nr:hypothetical protein GGR50DRAFT_654086 [Xylaria sp. CBS 124048]